MSCEVSDKSKNGSSKADHLNTRIPYGIRPVVKVRSYTLIVFQSTHPVWDATCAATLHHSVAEISIHASRMGCDVMFPRILRPLLISIHASRMGCDKYARSRCWCCANFNPRIPYGMRPMTASFPPQTGHYFNPRIPYGMRPRNNTVAQIKTYFNPRIPYGMRQSP